VALNERFKVSSSVVASVVASVIRCTGGDKGGSFCGGDSDGDTHAYTLKMRYASQIRLPLQKWPRAALRMRL
jgi:hypothetical protein